MTSNTRNTGGDGDHSSGDMEEEEDCLVRTRRVKSIRKVRAWQEKDCDTATTDNNMVIVTDHASKPRPVFRGRTPSYEALKCAVTELFRIDDFDSERLGEGFYSEVFKVTHKTTGKVMVLKKNKYRSNSLNSLKEIQLMNKLKHQNILKFEAVCVHEGQLHALTEFIDGGTLEEMIADSSISLSWTDRIRIGLDIAQGLKYLNSKGMFHRDLTSKNIFMKRNKDKPLAVIGDFGLATKIPRKTDPRLPQVGTPYWIGPECIRGEFYDQQADIFSFGIIMCELIARVEADPDILPRTQNFGVEYKAFSELCPACPADYLKLTFTCVSIDPDSRPSSSELVVSLEQLLEKQIETEKQEIADRNSRAMAKMSLVRGKSDNYCDNALKKSPSDKARLHSKYSIINNNSSNIVLDINARTVGEEMCRIDPHYEPMDRHQNPFTTLPRMRDGKKIIGSNAELFSSCVELPCLQNEYEWFRRKSLPYHMRQYSPSCKTKEDSINEINDTLTPKSKSVSDETVKIVPIQQTVRKLFGQSQDDSNINSIIPNPQTSIRRWGSCESGFFSASTDEWMTETGFMSNKSIGSSLLTVSDLEEDLRAASALLSRKRTSSLFSDSLEDISARLDDISCIGNRDEVDTSNGDRYEKDIREIVEYFERNCQLSKVHKPKTDLRSSTENVRSQKIESLIQKVAENKSRARQGKLAALQQQQLQYLQVCDGIVRSKLPLFDQHQQQQQQNRDGQHTVSVRKMGVVHHGDQVFSNLANNVKIVSKEN